MNESLKLILWWLAVLAGAALVLIAPFNLKGAGMAVLGALLVVYGLVPILKQRKLKRDAAKDKQP